MLDWVSDLISGAIIFATLAFAAGAVGMLLAESPGFRSLKEVVADICRRIRQLLCGRF